MGNISLIYTTLPEYEEACNISSTLLQEGLIACANILRGVTSLYLWKGKVQSSKEYVIIMKTLISLAPIVVRRIHEIHPYDVPALLTIRSDASAQFAEWVESCVQGGNANSSC